MSYYTYCCGKSVYRKEGVTVRGEGYYCSRCKKPVTVYGRAKTKEDKEAYKEKMKISGTGFKILPNGDLELLGSLIYRNAYKQPNKLETKPVGDTWIIFDKHGKFISKIWLEHINGAMYEVNEPFEKALTKLNLGAMRASSIEYYLPEKKQLNYNDDLSMILVNHFSYKLNKNGVLY